MALLAVSCVLTVVGGAQIGGKSDGREMQELRGVGVGEEARLMRGLLSERGAPHERSESQVRQELPEVINEPVASDVPEPAAEADSVAPAPATPIEAAICAYPWDCGTALRVARCESNLRPDAVGAGSYGLMQIQANVHAHKWPSFWDDWMIAERNLEYAWEIYQGRGWWAWSCF